MEKCFVVHRWYVGDDSPTLIAVILCHSSVSEKDFITAYPQYKNYMIDEIMTQTYKGA